MWGDTDSQEVGLEAAILERVRNSSLVECPRANNGAGLSDAPKPWIVGLPSGRRTVVGERSEAEKRDLGRPVERSEVRMPV